MAHFGRAQRRPYSWPEIAHSKSLEPPRQHRGPTCENVRGWLTTSSPLLYDSLLVRPHANRQERERVHYRVYWAAAEWGGSDHSSGTRFRTRAGNRAAWDSTAVVSTARRADENSKPPGNLRSSLWMPRSIQGALQCHRLSGRRSRTSFRHL